MTGRTGGRGALALAVVALGVLAGCGGERASVTTTLTGDAGTSTLAEAAPTGGDVPAGPAERGWLDDHGAWEAAEEELFEGEPMAGGAAAPGEGELELEAAPAATTVAAADADRDAATRGDVVEGEPLPPVDEEVGTQAPGLRAGSVDDNERFAEYLSYREQLAELGIAGRPVDPRGRLVVTVRGADGRPLLGAHVRLADGSDAATTGADGSALLFRPVPERQDVGIVPDAPETSPQQNTEPTTAPAPPVPSADVVVVVDHGTSHVEAPVQAGTPAIGVELAASSPVAGSVPLDVAFIIDATGSMDDEIERLRGEMIRVAERIAASEANPDVRFAMTVYRDKGDLFVTRTFDFTGDVQAFTRALGEVRADDGGDDPEHLEAALADVLAKPQWREGAVRLAFLVADAPPHLDYADSTPYTDSIARAREAGVRIFPIASSGLDDQGELVYRELAQATLGRFVFLTYGVDGASPGDETDHHVEDYSVLALDDLVVRLVEEELAPLAG